MCLFLFLDETVVLNSVLTLICMDKATCKSKMVTNDIVKQGFPNF